MERKVLSCDFCLVIFAGVHAQHSRRRHVRARHADQVRRVEERHPPASKRDSPSVGLAETAGFMDLGFDVEPVFPPEPRLNESEALGPASVWPEVLPPFDHEFSEGQFVDALATALEWDCELPSVFASTNLSGLEMSADEFLGNWSTPLWGRESGTPCSPPPPSMGDVPSGLTQEPGDVSGGAVMVDRSTSPALPSSVDRSTSPAPPSTVDRATSPIPPMVEVVDVGRTGPARPSLQVAPQVRAPEERPPALQEELIIVEYDSSVSSSESSGEEDSEYVPSAPPSSDTEEDSDDPPASDAEMIIISDDE